NGWCFVAPRLTCGEARGGSIPRSGAVTDEQRSHRSTWAQPAGRQFFSLQASLLAPYRSTSGYARRSRLAWTEKPLPQNTSHLGDTTLVRPGHIRLPTDLARALARRDELHVRNQNTKNQAPNTRKISNHKLQSGDVAGRIGIWNLGILWGLELGFWCFILVFGAWFLVIGRSDLDLLK